MDGVLTDFDKGLANYGVHRNDTSFIHLPKDQWTTDNHKLDKEVRGVMDQIGFWCDIPATSDAHELWNYCLDYKPVILTARPVGDYGDRIETEKRHWIIREFGIIPDDQFICCLRSEKKNFIGHTPHRHQILVDDLEANCREWAEAGGISIVHKSAKLSINLMKEYLDYETI